MAAIPIWKDTYYEINADNSPFSYSITTTTGTGQYQATITIFQGKAFVAPDEDTIKIRVSDICKDYLSMTTPAFNFGNDPNNYRTQNDEAIRLFELRNSGGTIMESYCFVLDWSYVTDSYPTGSTIQSHPINCRLAPNMYQMYTVVNTSTRRSYTYTHRNYSYPLDPSVPYKSGYCGHGALYYCNSYGGWDAFLIEGSVKRIDEFNRIVINSTTQNGKATISGNTFVDADIQKVYGKRSYNNQITPTWELKTSFISDSEAENLAKNLLRSNNVLFHDLDKDEIYPVILTDTQAEWKTYRNNGRKFVSYTITAQGAQTEQNIS